MYYSIDSFNTYILDANGQRVDYVITKEDGVPKAITIQDVTNDIQVFIHFQKTYTASFSLNAVSIDGIQTKIGEIQFRIFIIFINSILRINDIYLWFFLSSI